MTLFLYKQNHRAVTKVIPDVLGWWVIVTVIPSPSASPPVIRLSTQTRLSPLENAFVRRPTSTWTGWKDRSSRQNRLTNRQNGESKYSKLWIQCITIFIQFIVRSILCEMDSLLCGTIGDAEFRLSAVKSVLTDRDLMNMQIRKNKRCDWSMAHFNSKLHVPLRI